MTTLSMGRFKQADQFNNYWGAALSDDQSYEDALKPDFWAHNARFMKPGDVVRLLPERADYYAELLVSEVGAAYAKVKPLIFVELDDAPEDPAPLPEELSVEWKGPAVKYAVIRKSDGARLKDGFGSKPEAESWARNHLAALAR